MKNVKMDNVLFTIMIHLIISLSVIMIIGLSLLYKTMYITSSDSNYIYYNEKIVIDTSESEIINGLIDYHTENFFMENIPEEFSKAFIYHTQDSKDNRLEFYSLMTVESMNFNVYVSRPNSNGSIDYGPSQLNSENINNPDFIELYGVNDLTYIETEYTKYMIISYNYYTDLLSKYGEEYIFYTYNGGPKAKRILESGDKTPSIFISNITRYDNNVRSAISRNSDSLNKYITYHVSKDYLQLYNGSINELKLYDNMNDDFKIDSYAFNKVIMENRHIIESQNEDNIFPIVSDNRNYNTSIICFNNIKQIIKNFIIKKDEDVIITLDDRDIFKMVHIFIRNGIDIYFGTHYLYEFC